jgi:hypothetical protein
MHGIFISASTASAKTSRPETKGTLMHGIFIRRSF